MVREQIVHIATQNGSALPRPQTDLSLDGATAIRIAPGAPEFAHYRKLGPDLEVDFENGQSLSVRNFFVAGPEGDFSEILTPEGDVAISALLAPEPDPGDIEPVEGMIGTQGALSGPGTADPGDWSDPLMLTGAGLATALGAAALWPDDEGQDGAGAEAVATDTDEGAAADEIAEEVELLVPEVGADAALTDDIAEIIAAEGETEIPADVAQAGPVDGDGLDAELFVGSDAEIEMVSAEADVLAELSVDGEA